MSIESALRNRSALWRAGFDLFGYQTETMRASIDRDGELSMRAVREEVFGSPAAVIDVYELWADGHDPAALAIASDGCHLRACSWHAQIAPTGAVGAERLDLDRSKPRAHAIHRHPYGEVNDVRVAAAPLVVPAQWLRQVEEIIYDHFHAST